MAQRETYETFFKRLKPNYSPNELALIDLAYFLSKNAHRHQTRKCLDEATGEPQRYFEHPRRAAIIAFDEAECADAVLMIVLFLHDCVEDTRYLTPARIEVFFGSDVSRSVNMLTKRKSVRGRSEPNYVERLIAYGDWRTLLAKSIDRLDNLRSLDGLSKRFQRKQVIETRTKYYPLLDAMLAKVPPEYQKGALTIASEVRLQADKVFSRLSSRR